MVQGMKFGCGFLLVVVLGFTIACFGPLSLGTAYRSYEDTSRALRAP